MSGRDQAAGFTLLETLLALALLGFLTLALSGGLQFGRRTWDAARALSAQEETVALRSALRGWIEALPVAGGPVGQIAGDGRSMRFALASPTPARPDVSTLEVTVRFEDGRGGGLDLMVALRGFDDSGGATLVEERILAERLRSGRFMYFGRSYATEGSEWRPLWERADRAPDLIGIEATRADGRPWPPLTARPGFAARQRFISASSPTPPG